MNRRSKTKAGKVLVWVMSIVGICSIDGRVMAGVAGDLNCDGVRNGLDVAAFIQALSDPTEFQVSHPACEYFDGDLNADGTVDLIDTEMFTHLLMGPSDGPETTTGYINYPGWEWSVGITLGGSYTAHPEHELRMTLVELPADGTVYCYSPIYKAITTVPYELDSPWVGYTKGTWESGSPIAQLAYTVKSADDGRVSAPRHVAINRFPSTVPLLAPIDPQIQEDTPTIFELEILYEELAPPGDVLTLRIHTTVSPLFGNFYQVEADGVTLGSIITSGDAITNSDHLVGYVPTANFSGNSANFVWTMEDSMGLYSPQNWNYKRFTTMTVHNVNDPPFAYSGVCQATHLLETFWLQLSFGDIDFVPCVPGAQLTVTIHTLPEKGLIYLNTMAPENLISTPGTTFPMKNNDKLVYHKTQPGLGSPFDQLTWSVSDGCETTPIATTTINIVFANSPPVMEPVPAVTVEEDSDFTYITMNASDIDHGPGGIHWFIKSLPMKGVLQILNILGTAWVPVTVVNTQIAPTSPQVTVRYKPSPGANTHGGLPDQFSIAVSDNEDENPVHESVAITITAINDAPTISGSTQATARILVPGMQKVNAVISDLAVSDDADESLIEVGISATNASKLFLNSALGLVNFVQRTPTSVAFQGTVQNINAVLSAGVQFEPLAYGAGFINMTVHDLGNTSDDAELVNLTATHQVVLLVTP